MTKQAPIMHLRVERVFYGANRYGSNRHGSTHARACDPVLTVSNERSLTELPLMVTCKRCPLTRAYRAAIGAE